MILKFNEYLYILSVILLFESCLLDDIQFSIKGEWKGSNSEQKINFKFSDNNKCEIIIINRNEDFLRKMYGVYKIDFSKKPMTLSIKNIDELSHPLHTIFEFIDFNTIKISHFSPSWRLRPIAFENDKITILKRKN